jgi:hypothetical protein
MRTLIGVPPAMGAHPYPDRDTTFSPSAGPASRFEKTLVPVPRPNPERFGALPEAPERRAMKAYAAVVEEIEGIERLLRTDRRAYFRDEKKQERYRELLAFREKNRAWA